jgi:hypothetical protein
MIYTLLFSIINLFAAPPILPQDCTTFDVEVRITPAAGSGQKVNIHPSGGKRPYKIIFYKESGQLVSDDFTRQEHMNVPAGKYGCVVVDKNNCRKIIDIEVP